MPSALPRRYVLGIIILVKGASMALAIDAMLLIEWQVTGPLLAPPIVMFTLVAVLSLAIGVRAVEAVGPPRSADSAQAREAASVLT